MENTIKTERLVIRPIVSNDIDEIHEYMSDKSINMMMFLPRETIKETKEFVNFAVDEWKKKEPGDREYVILYHSKIIGGINLEYCEDRNVCEIGWVIHHNYRNQGFTTEAASAVFRFAFEDLNIDEITAHCDSKNIASERVMKKLKMKKISDDGIRYYPKTGITSGEYMYSITKSEYEGKSD